MKIEIIRNGKFGTCNKCGKGANEELEMKRTRFDVVSIYLCAECFDEIAELIGRWRDERKQ